MHWLLTSTEGPSRPVFGISQTIKTNALQPLTRTANSSGLTGRKFARIPMLAKMTYKRLGVLW